MEHVVVTGANRGLGRAIAEGVLDRGREVVMVCRSAERGEQARRDLAARFGDERVRLVVADLGDSDGVASAARAVDALPGRVAALVLNAGLWPTRLELDRHGHERSFAVNHLGPLELARRLLPRLERDTPSRIVFVGAGMHVAGRVDLERTPVGADFSPLRTYADTKACMALGARALAARLDPERVRLVVVHPGVVDTGLGQNGRWFDRPVSWVKKLWARPEDGARAPVELAVGRLPADAHGQWYDQLSPQPWQGPPADLALAERVYQQAVQLRPVDGGAWCETA